MENGPDSIVLRYLRKIDAGQDAVRAELVDVKLRLSALEQRAVLVECGLNLLHEDRGRVDVRLDRIDERIGRIERRLELTEADQ
jgi:hypothetical protein